MLMWIVKRIGGIFIALRVASNYFLPVFCNFEFHIFDSVKKTAPDKLKPIYEEHLSRVNYATREGDNRGTDLYSWKFLYRFDWERHGYFYPKQQKLTKLARFIAYPAEGVKISGWLYAYDGVLCSITFSSNFEDFKKLNDFRIEVKHMKGISDKEI